MALENSTKFGIRFIAKLFTLFDAKFQAGSNGVKFKFKSIRDYEIFVISQEHFG